MFSWVTCSWGGGKQDTKKGMQVPFLSFKFSFTKFFPHLHYLGGHALASLSPVNAEQKPNCWPLPSASGSWGPSLECTYGSLTSYTTAVCNEKAVLQGHLPSNNGHLPEQSMESFKETAGFTETKFENHWCKW